MLPIWKKLIESNAQELSASPDHGNEILDCFKKGRLAYFRNDIEGLKKAQDFFIENKNQSPLYALCGKIFKLRLWVRDLKSQKTSEQDLNESEKFFSSEDQAVQVLLVELLSIEAIACDIKKDYDLCYSKNMRAFKLADELQLNKKASILFYNGIVAQNHKAPAQLRLSKLSDSILLAQKHQDVTTVIAARTSLSNEYEILGCYNLAYEEIKKALDIATEHQYGSFNHGACLLSYTKICISLGRLDFAKETMILLEAFSFQEFSDAIKDIKNKLQEGQRVSTSLLSGDEQKVIEVLSQGPKSKYEIIETIYGQGDFDSLDNRFKQVLVRVRKKKGLIVVFNKVSSLYELVL